MQHLYIIYNYIKLVMSLEMFITSDIATAICLSCDKNEKLRLQALLLVKSGLEALKLEFQFKNLSIFSLFVDFLFSLIAMALKIASNWLKTQIHMEDTS